MVRVWYGGMPVAPKIVRDVEDAAQQVLPVGGEIVVQPPVHHRILIRQVEGMRIPEEDAPHRRRRPNRRGEVDPGLGLLRTPDREGVEGCAGNGGAIADAGERLAHFAPADAAAARREIGRLACLAVPLPTDAGPCAERRVVDLIDGANEEIEDEVVALRILA